MKIGFIGLGRMGKHMATNVVKAGFETYVNDLVPALVDQLVALGAKHSPTNQELAASVDVAFTMLPNGAIVEQEKKFSINYVKCVECGNCIDNCYNKAIDEK